MNTYQNFIEGKHVSRELSPVPLPNGYELPAQLMPFQRFIVNRALECGRFAIFADCGLGKTFMQLAWARAVADATGGKVIGLAPLAVIQQTKKEAENFGISLDRIDITNYERLSEINPADYVGVFLDESSILKNFTGKTKTMLCESFSQTTYRLCCTATPSPNDIKEIGNHSDFLGIMPSNEMLSRWFIRMTDQAGVYRLKGHAAKEFWRWVSSWGVSLRKPSDLGYSDDGYDLPPLRLAEHKIEVSKEIPGELFDVVSESVNATDFHSVLRSTQAERLGMAASLIQSEPNEPWIIWVSQNEESKRMVSMLGDGAVEVTGSESATSKASKFEAFKSGEIKYLVTKREIAAFGLNFQHCARQIFASLDFSFEGFYQSLRRSYRFGQKREVVAHIITTSNMKNVQETIERKRSQFLTMQTEMSEASKLEYAQMQKNLSQPAPSRIEKTDRYEIHLGDCVDVSRTLPDNSVDFSVFSPPFANLYIYSDSVRDMGNCSDASEFQAHFKFLCLELHRILKPGRIVAMHVKNLPVYRSMNGRSGVYDFRGDCIRTMEEIGFQYHSEITIFNDPVFEMQRTKTQRLLYKQLRTDSSLTGIGLPDYVILFRKWEGIEKETHVPISRKAEDFPLDQWQEWASPVWNNMDGVLKKWEGAQLESLSEDALSNGGIPIEKWFSPVWMDINKQRVLNEKVARAGDDEKHICPLQLDVIERCVTLWSNPGDIVFSPFAGIGSEGFVSLLLKRKFVGIELKPEYFNWAIKNLNDASVLSQQKSLF